jgi:phosphohistidine phosphatase SixA
VTGWPDWYEAVLRARLRLADEEPLDPQRPLALYGLDSYGWMAVAADLEQWVTIPDRLLLPSSFRTASTLWSVIEEALSGEPGGPA